MATVEIDSFVLKLKILWKAANLSNDANAGKVALTLRVGHLEESDHVPDAQHQRFRRSRNGPAQQRRREGRAAARESPAVEAVEGKAADEDNLLNHRAVEASGEHASEEDSGEFASEEDSDKGVGDLKLVSAEEDTDERLNKEEEIKDEICHDEIYNMKDINRFKIRGEYRNPSFKPWDKVDPNVDLKVLWDNLKVDNEAKGIKEIGDGSTSFEHWL